jgi:hypothetical protein
MHKLLRAGHYQYWEAMSRAAPSISLDRKQK